MSVILYVMWGLLALLVAPIVFCWMLFGVAWIRGLRSEKITPAHIIELWARGLLQPPPPLCAGEEIEMIDEARKLLDAAGLFYYSADAEQDDEDAKESRQTLNMNDVWCWACAWGEPVSDEELPEVARLFREYGWAGVLYWVSEKHDGMTSEFYDNNRYIEFVRNEERIRKAIPDYNKRAYHKETYTIAGERK